MPELGNGEIAALVVEREDVETGAVDVVSIDAALAVICEASACKPEHVRALLVPMLLRGGEAWSGGAVYRVRKPDA
jgi:hypothetical protein